MTFSETDNSRVESSLAFQTVIKQFNLEPGGYWISVSLENLDAPKISIVGLIKDKNKTSSVRRVRLNLPDIPENEPSFSTPLFVWSVDPREQGIRKYQPNAARMYGLYKDTLEVYVELYLPDSLAKAPSFDFRTQIVNAKGETMRETKRTLPNPAPGARSADLSRFPERGPDHVGGRNASLYLTFGLEGQSIARVKSGDFSIAWDLRSWEIPHREYLAEARFLLGDDEFKAFQGKPAGEQEQILDALWKKFDPTPDSGTNEAYDTFVERMDYINAHYGGRGPAILTPRGEIYLRYGAPDEIVEDVIPLNYDTLQGLKRWWKTRTTRSISARSAPSNTLRP
jgi:GWxTD domain-containing protein